MPRPKTGGKKLKTASAKKAADNAPKVAANTTPATASAAEKKNGRGSATGKRHRAEVWSSYIYKILKQTHPDLGMSRRAMSTMGSIINDMNEKLSSEAGKLARYHKKQTLASREVQSAVRLVFSGQLAKHAVSDGTKAVGKYIGSFS